MTSEEAKRAKETLRVMQCQYSHIRQNDFEWETIETAIEALEEQIPEKPYMESDGYADGNPVWDSFCPVCMLDFDGCEPIHCPKCGQAIDWSEDDD